MASIEENQTPFSACYLYFFNFANCFVTHKKTDYEYPRACKKYHVSRFNHP